MLISLLFYIFLTVIFTYPLIFKFNTSIYGYPSDAFETIWRFWWRARVGSLPELAEPYLLRFYGKWVSFLTNEIFAYNLLLFLSFPLAALAMYLLVFELTKNKYSGFISGLIYSFSLYHLWHGFAHVGLAQIQWLPLYVWSLIKLSVKKNLRWTTVTTLTYLLAFLTDNYYGYFLLLFTAAFVFGQFCLKKVDFKLFKCYLLTAFLIILTSIPVIFDFRKNLIASQVFTRPFDDLLALSARPWDYFLPSIYHPLFGKYVPEVYAAIYNLGSDFEYQSAFLPERVIYLGWAATGLAILGFVKGLKSQHRSSVLLFGLCLILMLWASGPAFVSFNSLKIPFPSLFFYKLFPTVRTYVRLGIMVLLCVSVLAGFGVKLLLEKIKTERLVFGVYCLIPLLVLFEVLNFPPFHNTDFSQTPEAYQWLKSQPGNFMIAEYPRDNDTSSSCEETTKPMVRNYTYGRFFQRIHGKQLLESEHLKGEVREKLSDLTNPETPGILFSLGVKYVVVHTREIFKIVDPLNPCHGFEIMPGLPDNVFGLKLTKKFSEAIVYEVLE